MAGTKKKDKVMTSSENNKRDAEMKMGFLQRHKWLFYGVISVAVSLLALFGIAVAVMVLM